MAVHRSAPLPTDHARGQWTSRGVRWIGVRDAWMAAEPKPAAADHLGADAARYHAGSDTLLVADHGDLITVYERDEHRRPDLWRIVDDHTGGQA